MSQPEQDTARRLNTERTVLTALLLPLLGAGQFLLVRGETGASLAIGVPFLLATILLSRRWARISRQVVAARLAVESSTRGRNRSSANRAAISGGRVVFRSRGLLAMMWAFGLGTFLAFGGLTLSGPGPDPQLNDYIGTAAFGTLVGAGFLRGTRMRLEVDDEGITAYGYLGTRRVPWSRIVDASADYGGLSILLVDGEVVTVTALGKSSWSTWLKRRTNADKAVEFVRVHASGGAG